MKLFAKWLRPVEKQTPGSTPVDLYEAGPPILQADAMEQPVTWATTTAPNNVPPAPKTSAEMRATRRPKAGFTTVEFPVRMPGESEPILVAMQTADSKKHINGVPSPNRSHAHPTHDPLEAGYRVEEFDTLLAFKHGPIVPEGYTDRRFEFEAPMYSDIEEHITCDDEEELAKHDKWFTYHHPKHEGRWNPPRRLVSPQHSPKVRSPVRKVRLATTAAATSGHPVFGDKSPTKPAGPRSPQKIVALMDSPMRVKKKFTSVPKIELSKPIAKPAVATCASPQRATVSRCGTPEDTLRFAQVLVRTPEGEGAHTTDDNNDDDDCTNSFLQDLEAAAASTPLKTSHSPSISTGCTAQLQRKLALTDTARQHLNSPNSPNVSDRSPARQRFIFDLNNASGDASTPVAPTTTATTVETATRAPHTPTSKFVTPPRALRSSTTTHHQQQPTILSASPLRRRLLHQLDAASPGSPLASGAKRVFSAILGDDTAPSTTKENDAATPPPAPTAPPAKKSRPFASSSSSSTASSANAAAERPFKKSKIDAVWDKEVDQMLRSHNDKVKEAYRAKQAPAPAQGLSRKRPAAATLSSSTSVASHVTRSKSTASTKLHAHAASTDAAASLLSATTVPAAALLEDNDIVQMMRKHNEKILAKKSLYDHNGRRVRTNTDAAKTDQPAPKKARLVTTAVHVTKTAAPPSKKAYRPPSSRFSETYV